MLIGIKTVWSLAPYENSKRPGYSLSAQTEQNVCYIWKKFAYIWTCWREIVSWPAFAATEADLGLHVLQMLG